MKRILMCDRLLKDKSNSDWKEGWELFYAFNKIGVECDIAGLDCPISEREIPKLQSLYDFIIVTENYPQVLPKWKWWNWGEITTPKMFWAIDTHLNNFNPWVTSSNFDYVGLNNKEDLDKFPNTNRFYFPYGISSKRFCRELSNVKVHDVVFLGNMSEDRRYYLEKYNIKPIQAFGYDYIREMQSAKICFNKSITYDLNAKNFEIVASGTFMLSNYNETLFNFLGRNEFIEKMFYRDEVDLKEKIEYYLNHDEEREYIASEARKFILKEHSYEQRCKLLMDKIIGEV